MSTEKQITKSDVDKTIKLQLNGEEFKRVVEKIVKDRIKNEKELENKVVDICKNVISQLHKALWIKRNTFIDSLTNTKA